MKRKLVLNLLLLLAICALPLAAFAQDGPPGGRPLDRRVPESVEALKLATPLEMSGIPAEVFDARLFGTGQETVIIRLSADSVADARIKGRDLAPGQVKRQAEAQQLSFLDQVLAADPNARVLARVQVVMNAVFVEVDVAALPALAADPRVVRIAPVADYELDLLETVPYIGGTAVQAAGYEGTGIRVAVLDSGIDYFHANLGGSGDPADFANNDPTTIDDGTFPTAKVIGGYDFVGGEWPFGPLLPDPDPVDDGVAGGHGTHVADIIAGVDGVAPGASLYAVKVCSSVSTSCSGIALIQGMEFAVDPDGDGDPVDRVDLVNMSLGANYGQAFDDDLSLAVNNATALGVLTVASAGNSGDKPYVTGTPAAAITALSVAQTNVPGAILPFLEILPPAPTAGFYQAVFQPWSMPLMSIIEAPLQFGDGAGGNLLGCDPFAPDSLAGKIVLVNRGVCAFTLKISNISQAGGVVGIIGLVTVDAPFQGGDGGDRPIDIPGYMVSLATANALRGSLPGGIVRFDPAQGVPLVGAMVGSSSRGPRNPDSFIKPEIGAPGASISAIAGTGTATGPFGGTSGAAPMVTGAAALLLHAQGALSPAEVKARLMNTGETYILNDAVEGTLAPISRIGGGEVRVDRALAAPAAAWDADLMVGALNFGFVDVAKDTVNLFRTVRVRNYSTRNLEYQITPTFRYENDASTGAVTVDAPRSIRVRAGRDATFTVKLTIRGAQLWDNYMNSGSMGASAAALTLNEFDGYLLLDDGMNPIHLAWHMLPRKAADVVARPVLNFGEGFDVVDLTNTGVGWAQNDAYALLAVSPNVPEGEEGEQAPRPDIRGVGINTYPVPAGFCSAQPSFLWAFAVNTWERQSHVLPVSFQFWLDINQDGVDDYVVLNRDLSGLGTLSDGRQVTWALNLRTGALSAYFFTEHATNTGNTVLLVCAEQVGLTGTDMLATQVNMDVFAQDFYFGGPGEWIEGLTVTPLGEQYYGIPDDLAGKASGTMTVYDFGPWPGNSPELGVMLFTNGDRGAGNRGGAVQASEALFFIAR